MYTPDIILSDLRMPNCDGKTLFEKNKFQSRYVFYPFYFLTAMGEVVPLTADAVLQKPIHLDKLLEVVNKALPKDVSVIRFTGLFLGD